MIKLIEHTSPVYLPHSHFYSTEVVKWTNDSGVQSKKSGQEALASCDRSTYAIISLLSLSRTAPSFFYLSVVAIQARWFQSITDILSHGA